jgi:two-component system sensor kinase FixL
MTLGAQFLDDSWRLASIVENSRDAIIGKTLDGVVTDWNRAAVEMFGYAAEEIIGRPISVLFPPQLAAEEAAILARVRQGEPIEHYETVRRRKDGQDIWVSLSVSPIRDPSGKVVGASKIVRDITEQRTVKARLDELKAELLHVSRLSDMGQMASALAHELNQPLSAASNYLQGTRRLLEKGDSERAQQGCDQAARQIARAGSVIQTLRDFVKKEHRRREALDLAEVVEESCRLALIGPQADGVMTFFEPSAPPLTVVIDKVQIQQVVVNLVRNAVEAMAGQDRRELIVRTGRAAADRLEVAIADTGTGLSDGLKATLFQPFTSTKASGMGVGLSLCRTIIEDHGGRIWADDGPSGGAVFRFALPSAPGAM